MKDKHIGCGCGVILITDNKILLGKRNTDPDKADSEMHEEGTWSLPGGNIEYGESFFEAGKREVKEETNLDVDELNIICVQTDLNEFAHYISVGMIANKISGELKVMEPDEIIFWKWFDLDKLPTNIFSASKKTIDCFLQKRFYIDWDLFFCITFFIFVYNQDIIKTNKSNLIGVFNLEVKLVKMVQLFPNEYPK